MCRKPRAASERDACPRCVRPTTIKAQPLARSVRPPVAHTPSNPATPGLDAVAHALLPTPTRPPSVPHYQSHASRRCPPHA